MKKIIIAASVLFFAVAGIIIVIKAISPEDSWICENGQWQRHGNPEAPKPEERCAALSDPQPTPDTEPAACQLDAKICSDGSAVGRVAPDCKFVQCPKEDLIVVELPQAGQVVASPLVVKGQARGTWYFEGDFPMKLVAEDGKLLAQGIAHSQGEWMTTEFVPFEEQLIFSAPTGGRGFIILEKNNPSDLEENSDELRIPVEFGK